MLRLCIFQRHILSCRGTNPSRLSSSRQSREAIPSIFLHQLSSRSFRNDRRSSVSASNGGSSVPTFEKKSKGQKKREAVRSVDWAIAFESFSDAQLRRAIGWGNLQEEVYEAVLTVKKIGRSGKQARNRQLKLIGGMLREADPELMEGIIKAINDGDVEGAFRESGNVKGESKGDHVNTDHHVSSSEDYEEELDGDEEEEDGQETSSSEDDLNITGHADGIVERWLQGLLSGDSDVIAEVYSIRSAEFDRQELRRLVRDTLKSGNRMPERNSEIAAPEAPASVAKINSQAKLRQYLESLTVKKSR